MTARFITGGRRRRPRPERLGNLGLALLCTGHRRTRVPSILPQTLAIQLGAQEGAARDVARKSRRRASGAALRHGTTTPRKARSDDDGARGTLIGRALHRQGATLPSHERRPLATRRHKL